MTVEQIEQIKEKYKNPLYMKQSIGINLSRQMTGSGHEESEASKMKKEPYIPTQTEWVRQFGKPSLILPIKGRWLRKIWSGEKKEEYREDKPYYQRLLEKYRDFTYFTVGFRAGYSMNSAFVVCLCKLKKGEGFEEWGAEKGKKYYVLELLKVYK